MKSLSIKRIAAAGVALCAPASMVVFSPAAHAAIVACSTTSCSVPGNTSPDGAFTGDFGESVFAGAFTETVDFVTTVAGLLSLGVSTTATASGSDDDTDFSGAFLTGTGIVGQENLTSPIPFSDIDERLRLLSFNVGPGTYRLTVQGTPGIKNASFAGTVAFNTSSVPGVPEPATWGMMLIGFGVIGAAMRRKRTSASMKNRVRFSFA